MYRRHLLNRHYPGIGHLVICSLRYREGTDIYVWDHYQESVPMSTYLVAFVVSKFEYVQSPPTGNNVNFRIWARQSALDQVTYAKEIGGKMLQYFETYFNVTYPLPKQVIQGYYYADLEKPLLNFFKFYGRYIIN